MNVEICSKKDTLQGILRFIQAVKVCSHVKYVQRLLTERTICTHILANAMKKIWISTTVVPVRKHFLKNGT